MYKPSLSLIKPTNKNYKILHNVKKEVTHKVTQKVTHPESILKMLHILGILTDHIGTSQLATIKSHVIGVYMIWENTKNERLRWKLAHTPTVNISHFLDNILKFRY